MAAITAGMPYDTLFTEHGPAARRLALTLVPPDAADDLVSEAFARVMAATGRLGPPASFRPYLLAAVRNCARTWHTARARSVPVGTPEPPEPAPGPERITIEREDARLAAAAFAALPRRWRAVLWATAVDETSVTELAQRWGMAPNAVSQLASRAREGLRQAYLSEHLASPLTESCRQVAPYMGAAVRGRASRRHERELSAHLGSCARCGQAFAGLGALNANLGALLVPGAALTATALTRSLLPAGRAGARAGLSLHAALPAVGTVAALATAGSLVLTLPSHGPGTSLPRAVAAAPSVQAGASYAPRHARIAAAASAAPAAGDTVASAVPAVSGALSAVRSVAATAGQAVASTGQAAGQAVTQTGQSAGQAVSGTTSVAGGTVSQAGQSAGGTVSGVTGTAGQLVQSVSGTVGGLFGGL